MPLPPEEFLERLKRENAALRKRVGGSEPARANDEGTPLQSPRRAIVEGMRAKLVTGDVRGALAILNGASTHRFTAIYRFDEDQLVNLCLVDRENPDAKLFPTIPVTASYCVYLREPERFFALEDSFEDTRVIEHDKQPHVRSYCGVVIENDDGSLYGSLCQFDFGPVLTPPGVFDLLDDVVRVLGADLRKALARR